MKLNAAEGNYSSEKELNTNVPGKKKVNKTEKTKLQVLEETYTLSKRERSRLLEENWLSVKRCEPKKLKATEKSFNELTKSIVDFLKVKTSGSYSSIRLNGNIVFENTYK